MVSTGQMVHTDVSDNENINIIKTGIFEGKERLSYI